MSRSTGSKKTTAAISLYLDYPSGIGPQRLLALLTERIPKTKIGYAGFNSKQALCTYLKHMVFDPRGSRKVSPTRYHTVTIIRTISHTIAKCQKTLPNKKPTQVFVFPTFSKFTRHKMGDSTGYTPWKNAVLIFLHPSARMMTLSKTVSHEYCHAVALNFHQWKTLLDSLVFEGLAEHFSERITASRRSPWTKVLSQQQSKKVLRSIQHQLSSQSFALYRRIFFGDKNYRQWTGYSLGYHIVGSFLRKNPQLSWPQLVKLPPKAIFQRAGLL